MYNTRVSKFVVRIITSISSINEPLGIDLHLSCDVLRRVVDGVDESAVMPEFDNGIEVGVLIWSDCEHE